jgi:hypothetical protein
MSAIHSAIGKHFERTPIHQSREFSALMDTLHDQMSADHRAEQDISTAFVEAQYDTADDNVLMFKAMSCECNDEELGSYVRQLMLRVARERAAA